MATKRKPQAPYLSQPAELNFDAADQFLASLRQAPANEPAEPRGMARAVADTALSFGQGAVQGVRLLTDLAGADNAVSGGLRTVEDFIGGLKSAQAKQDQQEVAAILKAAEGAGILDQVIAGAKAFAVAPVQTLAQAAGTSIPTLATALIPGVGQAATAARMAGALGMGAAQGAGGVKSSIYDAVRAAPLEGETPEQTEARAVAAQEFAGPNAGQIAVGAGLGAWAGKSGMESALERVLHGTTKAAPGLAKRVGIGAVAEGIPEAAQGGQEKYATNTALANEGFVVDPMSGVVANATMEGLAGFGMGGAMGIPKPAMRPGDALRAEGLQPERGPATRALNAAVEAAAAKVDAGAAVVPPEPGTQPDPTQVQPAPAAPAAPAPDPAAIAQREADRPPEPTGEVMPGDLLTKAGQPFKSMQLAMKALARAGGEATHELVPVAGGLVIRPKQAADGQPSGNAQPGAADGAAVPGNLGVAEQPTVEPGNQADAGAAVVSPAPGGDAAGIQPGSDGPVPELSDDLPTLKKAWADATAAGDTAGAARINDAIVEAKRKAKGETPDEKPKLNAFGLPMGYKPGSKVKVTAADLQAGDWISAGGRPSRVVAVAPGTGGKVKVTLDNGLSASTDEYAPTQTTERYTPEKSDAPAAPKAEPVNAAAPATDPAGDLSAPAGARTPQEAAAPVTGTDSSELPMGQPAGGEARVVRVNGQEYALTPEQRADMDRVEASFKVRFDAAKATFEATKNNPPTDNPDVGLKSARERYDAEQKALGMQLSAERRRIVGAQTPKEKAAKAELDARVRNGDQVQTPEGLGTVTGNNFGKVRVQVNGQTRTFPRADVTKVEAQAAPTPAPAAAPAAPAPASDQQVPDQAESTASVDKALDSVRFHVGNRFDQKAGKWSPIDMLKFNAAVAEAKRAGVKVRSQAPGSSGTVVWTFEKPNGDAYSAYLEKSGKGTWMSVKPAAPAASTPEPDAAAPASTQAPAQAEAPGAAAVVTWQRKPPRDGLPGSLVHRFTTSDDMDGQVLISPPGWRKGVKSFVVSFDRTGGPLDEKGRTKFYPTVDIGKYRTEEAARIAAEKVIAENRKASTESKVPEPSTSAPAAPASESAAPGAAAPAPAPKPTKAEMRPYRRADGSIGYEAVPIIESAATAVPAPAPAAPTPSANTVFTEDAAAAARSRLKVKLGRTQSGLDPETIMDGITLAGYHIEKGARTFAAYARAMVDDLGDGVKPYLQSWYMAVRSDPRAAGFKAEMDKASAVEDLDVDAVLADSGTPAATAEAQNGAKEAQDGQADQPSLGAGDTPRGGSTQGGRGTPAQQPDARQDSLDLEGAQPGDVAPADGRSTGAAPGDGAASPDVEAPGGTDARGPARNGRPRGGRARNPDAGTGSRGGRQNPGQPATPAVEPSPANTGPGDFAIDDPMRVVGGGQVARFEKNKAAIDLRNTLIENGRKPTPEEQEVLAGYTGWGSFGQELFQGTWATPAPKKGWEARDRWLRDNLGQKEWEGMQTSIINAHYTDPPTVMAMWDMVKRMGFTGGRTLEPSIGIGNFYGMMPADLTARSQRAGIELDPVTGSMAQMLYPNANIQIKGYEQSTTPDNFYDLVIGNWPFSEISPADRKYNRIAPTLHDYFFLKAIDQTRPGGLIVGITTKGTMDKKGVTARMEMARKAELVAAFRLPSGAFEEYAGTKVVTDIIILRKREKPIGIVDKEGWIEVKDHDTPSGTKVPVNEYFHANPTHVIGTIDFGHGTTTFRPGLIVNRPDNMMEQLRRVVELVPEGVFTANQNAKHISYVANHTSDRTNSLTKTPQGLFIVAGEYLAPANEVVKYELKDATKTAARVRELESLIDMRRLYAQLIDAERDGKAEPQRKKLREAYEAFVKASGPMSESFGLGYLRKIDDPFYPSLAALEMRGEDAKGKPAYRPAAILSQSTMRGARGIQNPGVTDAFVLARNESVNPSLARIAELAKKPEAEVKSALIDAGAAYEMPNGDFAPSDVYLSGNVREKLREAKAALESGNRAMQRNVDALTKVLPPTIPYYKIETQMGATWVPPGAYGEYIAHMLGLDSASEVEVKFEAGGWKINFDGALNHRPQASSGFGSPHVRFKRLVRAAISNQTITVKYKDRDGVEYVDEDATKEVNGKIADMRLKFGEWLWKDPTRRTQLEAEYNEVRNAYATPRFDGSFLGFQGMALSLGREPFNLREHQINAIWRALVTRKSLNAHEVGTGKTFTMGGIAVESRRYGIAKKPLLLAHNANSKSVAHEIQMMYPAAKILYVDNLSKENLKTRMMQIANDDWDLIVIPHSVIDRIGFKEETLMGMAQEELLDLQQAAEEAAAEDGATIDAAMWEDEEELAKLRSPTAKQLVKSRLKIITTIQKLAQQASKDGAVSFEDLGVDMVMVDEAHEFKKPPIATKMKMKGLQTQTSNRSIALMFLTKYVRSMNNGANVHLFTGTPITNTMTEVFHMMRYMMQEEMKTAALADWDGWFGSFAREVNDVELNPAGEYEAVTRLQSFINVPELRRMIGQYMDVVFAEDMPEMQLRLVDGKRLTDKDLTEAQREKILNGRTIDAPDRPYKKVVNESSDMTPDQMRVFEQVQGYARSWRSMTKKNRKDAMLRGAPESPIIHEGIAARASFDVRLVDAIANAGLEGDPSMEPHPDSKPARVLKNLLRIYKGEPDAAQVVFMEQGMAKSVTRREGPIGMKRDVNYPAFSTVVDMIERLVQAGVPREQIALVDGSTSKDKRKEVADGMNSGRIRIVFGSTDSLGVGVNMQRNLRAMHHMDAPWMPGELEQRNGRGHRQGNQWNTVFEFRYLTDRLDGRRWQVLAIKQKFITDFMKSKGDARVIEGDAASEEGSDILSTFSEAAGDPRLLLKEKFKKKLEHLQSRERMHGQAQADAADVITRGRDRIASSEKRIADLRKAGVKAKIEALIESTAGDGFNTAIGKERFTSRADALVALDAWVKENIRQGDDKEVGEFGGQPLYARWEHEWQSSPDLYMRMGAGVEVVASVSFGSLERQLRGVRDSVESHHEQEITNQRERMQHAETVVNEPFHLQKELGEAKKRLYDLEADIQMNPVAPPYWLRSGAPVDTDVYRDGKPFTVAGHRWAADGYYVIAQDAKGYTAIPYMEARDSQGMTLYEEHDFTAPSVQQGSAAQNVPTAPPAPKAVEAAPDEEAGPNIAQTGAPEANTTDVVFSRAPGRGISARDAQAVRATVRAALPNAPDIILHESIEQAPEDLQEAIRTEGAEDDVEAVYWNGEIHAFPKHMASVERALFVIGRHEVRHHGMRTRYGGKLDATLLDMHRKNQNLRQATQAIKTANRAGEKETVKAIEEALADMPVEQIAALTGFDRFVAAMRDWLRMLSRRMRKAGLAGLADAIEPKTWTDADVAAFVLKAEKVSGAGGGGAAFSRADGDGSTWFSALVRAVSGIGMGAAPAQGWKDTIKGMVGKGAVKADEVEWTGLNEWLDLQTGKVTKAQVSEYLAQNGVRVTETVLSDAEARELPPGWTVVQSFDSESDDAGYAVLDEQGAQMAFGETRDEAIANSWDEESLADDKRAPKYGQYTLPGGSNYREILLTLPVATKKETFPIGRGPYEARRSGGGWYIVDRFGEWGNAAYESKEVAERFFPEHKTKEVDTPTGEVYQSGHWDQPNVLAHIRVNDRTDADGKRVLFVEEIQSDHAQTAKKMRDDRVKALAERRGITEKEADALVPKDAGFQGSMIEQDTEWQAVDALADFETKAEAQAWADANPPPNPGENMESRLVIDERPGFGWKTTPTFTVVEQQRSTVAQAPNKGGVPRAPFVDATDKWVALALKRIVKMAVDGGYDKVAFVTGEQSADRYDLSKQISMVRLATDDKAGSLKNAIFNAIQISDGRAINRLINSEKELEDVIGKDLATKLLQAEPKKVDGGWKREVSGLDLKMGGEGMRAFYDKIVPGVAKDVLRKLGGGAMESVQIATPDSTRTVDNGPNFMEEENRAEPDFDTEDVPAATLTQPGFTITPAMREKTRGGVAMFSRSTTLDTMREAATARNVVNVWDDLTRSQSSFNWWHRTVATQYHKAHAKNKDGSLANPGFKAVYDRAQEYLHDTSAFANDPADLAPTLLPQLKNLGDLKKRLALKKEDADALATAIFEGTLNYKRDDSGQLVASSVGDDPGVVFTPDELRTLFGFNTEQIKLYREARRATDRSLDILAAADVARLLGDILPEPMRAMISAGDLGRFKGIVKTFTKQQLDSAQADLAEVRKRHRNEMSAHWRKQKAALEGPGGRVGTRLATMETMDAEKNALKFKQGGEKYRAEQAVAKWADLERTVREKYERISELQAKGYAPLMRFGRYTVDVLGADGSRQFFGMFETEREANAAARKFREGAEEGETVTQGILSEEAFKQFSGLTPETIELFAEVAGVEKNELFQEYLRRAKNNRSALKRLIKRKGMEGFSEDTARVLASFITSNARAASASLHLGAMSAAVEDIPKEQGDVKDEAIKLREYVQNPQEEAQGLRSLLFAQYLGGSVASALVNMTQPLMMTLPYLSQFGGPVKAASRLAAAVKTAAGTVDTKTPLGRALRQAEKEGVVEPQELHQLQAEASRTVGNNPHLRRLLFAWGGFFSLAERFNRRVSFIAAFNTAQAQDMADPFAFASRSVDETQGVYNKGNRPNWARGAIGATVFTFKQYSISYVEFLKRLPKREKALALAILVLAAGAQGLPGADDLDDLIDTLGQHMGYDTNSKLWKTQALTAALGEGAADFVLHGFSALPGIPLDVSGRLSLGNLIPGTGMLRKDKADKAGEVTEALGPAASTIVNTVKAFPALLQGDLGKVNELAGPTATKNLGKALTMYLTGEYRDGAGRKVTDVTPGDAAVKAIGFQPAEVARDSRKATMAMQQIALARSVEAEIASQWAQGLVERKPEQVRKARERLAEWNQENPASRIGINSSQIRRRVQEMRTTRDERLVKRAPKEMRATTKETVS